MHRWSLLGGCAAGLLAAMTALGADPQPYQVKFVDPSNKALSAMLQASSDLSNLRKTAPVGPFGLIGRAEGDIKRLKTVMESFGYYQSNVLITIDSLSVDGVGLGEELTHKPAGDDAHVTVAFELGPLYHLGKVDLTGNFPDEAAASLNLSSGSPAVAADVLASVERVRQTLANDGYAFAKVEVPHAKENASEHLLNLSIDANAGARYQLGEIRLTGLRTINESYVRKRLLIHPGDLYRASAIEAARRDLLTVGVFTQVTVTPDTVADAAGRVPLTIKFIERKPRTVAVTGTYSSDLGASAGVKWLKREITGNADSLSLSASVIDLGGGTATDGVGYDLDGKYALPDWKTRDQSLQVEFGALRQYLNAYDQTAVTSGVSVIKKMSRIWTVSAGLTLEEEKIVQEAPPDTQESVAAGCATNLASPKSGTTEPRCTYHYTLIGFPINATFNTTGLDSPLADATKGVRASLSLTPTFSVGRQNSEFLVAQLTASAYFDLTNWGLAEDPGRRVIAVRALTGLAAGASEFSLPPDQRFYAGGSGTIRGYRYQSVGPTFEDGNPIGGTAIHAGSIEFRQRVGAALGFATFVDGGNVSRNLDPLSGSLKIGVGVGVRYYTALGPLRFDLAVPLERRSGPSVVNPDDAFEVYIGLGQAF